jgi:hypothetical protein
MKQLNFTERAARSLNTEATLLSTTTELYDLYSNPEDISLFIQIVGDNNGEIPDLYIDDVTLKNLRCALSQLNIAALNNCVIWLRAHDGKVLQEFATVCDKQWSDFVVDGCNFRLNPFAEWRFDYSSLDSDTVICHEDEVNEIYNNIKNIINNNNR